MTRAEILTAIEEMSVLELSELVKELEEKFGVSAAAPAMMMAAPAAGAAAPAAEEKTEFNVVLKETGARSFRLSRSSARSPDLASRMPRTSSRIPASPSRKAFPRKTPKLSSSSSKAPAPPSCSLNYPTGSGNPASL